MPLFLGCFQWSKAKMLCCPYFTTTLSVKQFLFVLLTFWSNSRPSLCSLSASGDVQRHCATAWSLFFSLPYFGIKKKPSIISLPPRKKGQCLCSFDISHTHFFFLCPSSLCFCRKKVNTSHYSRYVFYIRMKFSTLTACLAVVVLVAAETQQCNISPFMLNAFANMHPLMHTGAR